jgi:hypothetical protein
VEKYCRAGWAIDDNLAHAPVHAGYQRLHTRAIRNTNCLSAGTVAPQMCLTDKLYEHFLSCWNLYIPNCKSWSSTVIIGQLALHGERA